MTLLFCLYMILSITKWTVFGEELPSLKVSENGRYFVDQNGKPFFYLADTAWELFHRLNREEADEYLKIRAEQGFTVIHAVLLSEFSGLTVPNAYGDLPLENNDPTKPVEAYFRHVDYIVEKANSLGLVVGMVPTWGDKVNKLWGIGPQIFNEENAFIYGNFLGERYKNKKVLWVNGGDRPGEQKKEIWRQIARGLKAGREGRYLITYHGNGALGKGSSLVFHNEDWLDFNMYYSGHTWAELSYEGITRDYNLRPVKPTVDGEPKYENHPYMDDGSGYHSNPALWDGITRGTPSVIRENAYWNMLAGAAGHVYGCNDIWQYYDMKREPITHANTHWRKAIYFSGAVQMGYMRKLLESRPWYKLVPDQSIIIKGQGRGRDHVQAARADDGSFILAYITLGYPIEIDLNLLSGEKINAYWFDPRKGTWKFIAEYDKKSIQEFNPPRSNPYGDWVLVLDDASKGYETPVN